MSVDNGNNMYNAIPGSRSGSKSSNLIHGDMIRSDSATSFGSNNSNRMIGRQDSVLSNTSLKTDGFSMDTLDSKDCVITYSQNPSGGHSLNGLEEGNVVNVIASATVKAENGSLVIGDITHVLDIEGCKIKKDDDESEPKENIEIPATPAAAHKRPVRDAINSVGSTLINAMPNMSTSNLGIKDTVKSKLGGGKTRRSSSRQKRRQTKNRRYGKK
jgi:hypothetical protein